MYYISIYSYLHKVYLQILNVISDSESSDSEDEQEAMRGKHDLLVDGDLTISKKSSKKELPPMFPYYEEKFKFDPYGEIIKYNFCIFFFFQKWLFIFIFNF